MKLMDNVVDSEVSLVIENSNNTKSDDDKSGNGIGLNQVKARLDLLYPNKYEWKIEETDSSYKSSLTIKTE